MTLHDSSWINFLFVCTQRIQSLSLLQCCFLWKCLWPNNPLPVYCRCSKWSSCCFSSNTFSLTVINPWLSMLVSSSPHSIPRANPIVCYFLLSPEKKIRITYWRFWRPGSSLPIFSWPFISYFEICWSSIPQRWQTRESWFKTDLFTFHITPSFYESHS